MKILRKLQCFDRPSSGVIQ